MSASQQSTELSGQLSSHKILPLLTPFGRTGPTRFVAGTNAGEETAHAGRHRAGEQRALFAPLVQAQWRVRERSGP